MSPTPPMLAFYGDDFTGSTDALESLSRAGARTVLFLEPPTPQQIARFPDLDAIGIAGLTRSMHPEPMEEALRPAFEMIKETGVPFLHYKICSTFDSSPEIGNIGVAIEMGYEVFDPPFVPVIVGAPSLGRHCVFGNLFARFGAGSEGAIHRLDRHPAMRCHPVTPAKEADLTLHLGEQTNRPIGLLDILTLRKGSKAAVAKLDEILADGAEIVFFDLLDEEELPLLGNLLESRMQADRTVFSVGSSGVGMALGAHWQATGKLRPQSAWPTLHRADPLLVLSGSASPVTAGQIEVALEAGFVEVALDTVALLEGSAPPDRAIFEALEKGQSVVAHTCRGPDDPRLKQRLSQNVDTAAVLGGALGRIGRHAAEESLTKRIVFTGGDSSSHAARALGLEAVEMLVPLSPGAPLCRAFSPDEAIDGLEVNFKGGQVGKTDYFLSAAGLHPLPS